MITRVCRYHKIFAFFFLLLLPTTTVAAGDALAGTQKQLQSGVAIPTLPTVTVEATRLDPLIGASTLSRELIEKHPNRNSSVNELLSIMPGVHFAEEKDSSFTGGDIKPPNLSISGGRTNDNNFLIDGIGNNSLLDPLFDTPNSLSNIPGHPQEIFIGTDLIEQVTVYDHNIPARYGNFTGGVIESTTKDPSPDFEGTLGYRITRGEWTSFYVAPADQAEFIASDSDDQQPRFTKQYVSGEVSIPLTANSGLLAAYEQRYSSIPLQLLTRTEDQTRRIETYFLKYLLELSDTDRLRLSTTFSPYEEERFLRGTRNSQFSLHNDAWAVTADYRKEGLSGDGEIKAAYRESQDRREAPNQLLSWKAENAGVPTSKNWGTLVNSKFSKEGGLGDLDRTQQSVDLTGDWQSIPIGNGALEHTLNFGFQYEGIRARLDRRKDTSSYTSAKFNTGVICAPDDIACVSGEQYLSKRKIYRASSTKVRTNQYSLYAEDSIEFKRLVLRPAVRYSYDDLMEKHNTAPRLAASLDLFDNTNTLLIGGWNRYYDRTVLTYKIRESILPHILQTRSYDSGTSTLTPWVDKTYFSPLDTQFSKLETPYADELTFGLDQALFNGRMLLEYIQRRYVNQLAKEIDPFDLGNPYTLRHITLNNNGRKDYKSYRLAWERQWPEHFLSINIAYEEVKSSNDSYDDTFNDEDLADQIWYDGELIYRYELPREDYTRPWTANLTWVAELPARFTFTNVTKYRSRYKRLDDTRQNTLDGYDIYAKVTKPSSLVFDWRISWKSPAYRNKDLTFSLDIYNVFDRKNTVGTQDDQFGLGRQYWADISFSF